MMDWEYIQIKHRNLKWEWDASWETWVSDPTDDNYNAMSIAKSRYSIFCMDVLEQLMEKNQDVLQRLKNGG
jgi:hypothetical protein